MSNHKARQAARKASKDAPRDPNCQDADDIDAAIDEHEHGGAAKPISLHPLDFDTAIGGLMRVKVPPMPGRRDS